MLYDFVVNLYKLLVKTKQKCLRKICLYRRLEFFKNISITKKRLENQKLRVAQKM